MKLDNTISQLCANRFPTVNDTMFKQWIIDFAKEVNFTPGHALTMLNQPGNKSLIAFPYNGRQILNSITVDEKSVLEIDFMPIDGLLYDKPSVNSSVVYSGMHGYVMLVGLSETGIELAKSYIPQVNQSDIIDQGFQTFLKNILQIISKIWKNIKGFLAGMAVMATIFGAFQTVDSPTFQKTLSTIVQK